MKGAAKMKPCAKLLSLSIAIVLTFLCCVAVLQPAFAVPLADNCEDHVHTDCEIVYMTEEEYYAFLANNQPISMPRGYTCCDKPPKLVWRLTKIYHIYQPPAGLCLSLAYFGDQYCSHCGSVWQTGICYKQDFFGCGQYHGGTGV